MLTHTHTHTPHPPPPTHTQMEDFYEELPANDIQEELYEDLPDSAYQASNQYPFPTPTSPISTGAAPPPLPTGPIPQHRPGKCTLSLSMVMIYSGPEDRSSSVSIFPDPFGIAIYGHYSCTCMLSENGHFIVVL